MCLCSLFVFQMRARRNPNYHIYIYQNRDHEPLKIPKDVRVT